MLIWLLLTLNPQHFGRQNQLFEQNATEREKTQDWLAEKIGSELVVAFRRTIALYWPTKCVFRLSAANRESKPKNRADCTVQDRQCEPKCQFFFLACTIASLGEGPIRRDSTVSAPQPFGLSSFGYSSIRALLQAAEKIAGP
jgi:hypothetical protein